MASKRRRHRNPNGHWCNCPWGQRELNDPIDDLWDVEKYGSKKVAWIKESAKLDWLRSRPDMAESHHQKFLDHLESNFPEHDNLFPWLARERKKSRLHEKHYGNPEDAIPDLLMFTNKDGRIATLGKDHLEVLQDWMKYKKQAKQGVDIMQHHIGDAIDQSDKWDGMGETLHESEHYPGWTVKLLRNRRDLRKEGERMNHCLGGMNYHEDQARGEGAFYSVRDPQNDPHASLELRRAYNAEDVADPRNPQSHHYRQGDYYGEGDGPVPYEAQEVMNEFMGPKGHYLEPSQHEEEEQFEPWWDSEYHIDGPSDIEGWLQHSRGEYEEYNQPDEYERAHADAYENDLEGPDLYTGGPAIDDIWNDLEWKYGRDGVDPEQIAEMFKTMDEHGYGDEWREKAKEWFTTYQEELDPYGQSPDWSPQKQDQWSDPHAPAQGPGELLAPGMPGSYYPGRANPHDEYLARNLEYHLNANPDPRPGMEGEYLDQNQMERVYPQENAGFDPHYREDVVDPAELSENPPPRRYRLPIEQRSLGESSPEDNRGGWAQQPWGGRYYHPGEQNEPPKENSMQPPQPFRGEPETWDQGGTTNWHQLPIQGLEEYAPQPGHVNQYFRGEPQGRIFPKSWYFDRTKGYGKPTDLPPHLFPPDKFMWQDLQVHPQQMPMWSAAQAEVPGQPAWDRATGQYDFENREPRYIPPPEGQSWDLTRGQLAPNELSPTQERYRYRMPNTQIRPGEHPTVPFQAKYHPRDDDEWIDDDEPEFTATQPEPRWTSS